MTNEGRDAKEIDQTDYANKGNQYENKKEDSQNVEVEKSTTRNNRPNVSGLQFEGKKEMVHLNSMVKLKLTKEKKKIEELKDTDITHVIIKDRAQSSKIKVFNYQH